MKKYLENRDLIILIEIITIFILLSIILVLVFTKKEPTETNEMISISTIEETTTTTQVMEEYYVDIKGAVKKPGVYKVKKGSIVNDVIKLAGGVKSTAYTGNINLSQTVKNEMVIYIFTKNELKSSTVPITKDTLCTTNVIEVNNCITSTTTTSNNNNNSSNSLLINLNTATKEELMTLSGIGESKAIAILEYRKNNKFNTIEDLMNVSGIGESMYAKIKDNITV